MFLGFIQLGSAFTGALLTKTSAGVPTNATGAVTVKIYGPDGLMTNGTLTATQQAAQTGLYYWTLTPSANDGYAAGTVYYAVWTATISAVSSAGLDSFVVT